mgnify:CR=1 FL=1
MAVTQIISLLRHTPPHRVRVAASIGLLVFVSTMLLSCSTQEARREGRFLPRNAILLWHNLTEPEATALDNVLDRYRRANPDVEIVVQPQGPTMEEAFIRSVRSGLGPNLLLSNSANVRMLAEANSLVLLDDRVSEDVSARFLRVALRTLYYKGHLYGLPMAIDTQVLYFNRQLVERPAATVDQLMQEASSGQRVLMNSQFTDAVWSARTFGVDLFDAEGNPQDATGGVANWLTWMEQVRDIPGFIIDDNTPALRERFLRSDIPYYVGHSYELNMLNEVFGADLGVAQLPSGPAGSAGPLLTTSALLLNAMSSEHQIELSLDLARFISSSDQQAALMREANIVPANTRTRISEGLYPHIATVTAQARTAIPYFNDAEIQEAFSVLATAYNRTMTGMASATEAAIAAQITLIEEFNFPGAQSVASACIERGELTVLTPDSSELLIVLRTLVDNFSDVCPGVRATIQTVSPVEFSQLVTEGGDFSGIDLLLIHHRDLRELVNQGAIAPISALLDPTLVQQMRPIAATAMHIGSELYGAPILIDMQTLYHNKELINDAGGTLADLRAQGQGGVPVLLDASFEYGYWGVGAFGGRLFTDDGQFAVSPTALTDWLTWLQESQQNFGIRTTPDRNEALEQFLARQSAYLIGSSLRLNELLSQFGSASLSVALFPQGPAGPGRPLASARGLVLVDGLSPQQTLLANLFLSYAAGVQAQSDLLLAHRILPANSAVLLDRNPNVTRMAEQLQFATLVQYQPWLESVFVLGDQAYVSVLVDGVAPAEAVSQMYIALEADAADTGIVVPTPEPTPTPDATLTPPDEPVLSTPFAAPEEDVDAESTEEAIQEGATP